MPEKNREHICSPPPPPPARGKFRKCPANHRKNVTNSVSIGGLRTFVTMFICPFPLFPPPPRSLGPFHHAFPVHDLPLAKRFYGEVLGLSEGRSSLKWQDYSLDGHQIVCHLVSKDYRCQDYVNPVDGDRVPVPHTGLAMTVEQFHQFAGRLRKHGVDFVVEPHLRFKDQPGEQWTMFFKDPSGNNLEFKAMTNPDNLFARYNVDEFDYGAGGDSDDVDAGQKEL
ncbi:unnamed protein product [Ectocarpus sp. 8 AP-2014]